MDLTERAMRCGFRQEVPLTLQREFHQLAIDLYRHLGAYQESVDLARKVRRQSRTVRESSYDDQARADLDYAAALYAPHRFDEMRKLLAPWQQRLTRHPLDRRCVNSIHALQHTRRALVAMDQPGWEELFGQSDRILAEVEPTERPRTLSYLAQGYLRSGHLKEADSTLRRIESLPNVDDMSRRFLRFWQADAARRKGKDPGWIRKWSERAFRSRLAIRSRTTSRPQPGSQAEKSPMLWDAFSLLAGSSRRIRLVGNDQNIQHLLVACIRLAEAGWAMDAKGWAVALAALKNCIRPASDRRLHEHYSEYVPAEGSSPSRELADRLLSRVPFF